MANKTTRKRKIKKKIAVLFSLLVAIVFLFSAAYFDLPYLGQAIRQIAGPFFAEKITPEDIKNNYNNGKVKILIVAGHDNDSSGAQFKGIKEAQLNAVLANHFYEYLKNDSKFDPIATRKSDGQYNDWFSNYLKYNKQAIKDFRRQSQKTMKEALNSGNVSENNIVYHNDATDEDSLKLYAVNKWANDNGVDIVFHIHFNDYPGRYYRQKGEYSGFSIYIPEGQLPNHRSSSELAQSLKTQLEKYFPKSNLPQEKESDALIEDQELIAIGSNATREGASVLVEYGYIYETSFEKAETRPIILKELALQTYLGIKKFFNDGNHYEEKETTLLPYIWKRPMKNGIIGSEDVLRLQMALYHEGIYPPAGKNFSDCPFSGVFGKCTLLSVMKFQEKYKDDILLPEKQTEPTGYVGPGTIKKLNEIYGN